MKQVASLPPCLCHHALQRAARAKGRYRHIVTALLLMFGWLHGSANAQQCTPGCLTPSLTVNTGFNHATGTTYAIGAQDDFWRVNSDASGGVVPRSPYALATTSPWTAAQTNSRWIGTNPTAATPLEGIYSYQLCFCVCEASTISINLSIKCDNSAMVFLDGVLIGSVPNPGHLVAHPVVLNNKSVKAGTHCIEIKVNNSDGGKSGLNVAGSITGTKVLKLTCCPGARTSNCNTPSLSLATGINHLTGAHYAIGREDGFWHLISSPEDEESKRCPFVITKAPAWGNPHPTSEWIGPNPTHAVSEVGIYKYQKCFCVSKTDHDFITIDIGVMADNEATVYLDGQIISIVPSGLTVPTPILHAVPVKPGKHCIEIWVNNTDGGSSGLNVSGSVSGQFLEKYQCCSDEFDCECLTDVVNLNSGVNHAQGTMFNIDDEDGYWKIVADPTTKPKPRCGSVIARSPSWSDAQDNSHWVAGETAAPGQLGSYIFEREFHVSGSGSTFNLNLSVLASAAAIVTLDGMTIGTIPGSTGATIPTVINWTGPLVTGPHFIRLESFPPPGNLSAIDIIGTITKVIGPGQLVRSRCGPKPLTCCPKATISINTGMDHLVKGTYGFADQDAYWHVAGGPEGSRDHCAHAVSHPAGWDPPEAHSTWIAATPKADNDTIGTYKFQRCFCVSMQGNVTVDMRLRSDNEAEVFLNGILLGINPPFGDDNPINIHQTVNLPPGFHCLEVRVKNTGGEHSGFNAIGTVSGQFLEKMSCCSGRMECCDVPMLSMNTGYDHTDNSTFDIDDHDNHWTVVEDHLGGTVPRCANVIARPDGEDADDWDAPQFNSQWISSEPGAENDADGTYAYEKCFCVSEATYISLFLNVMADDRAEVFLDGVSQGSTNPPFTGTPLVPQEFLIDMVPVEKGRHCLKIVVNNTSGDFSGLNVSGFAFGKYLVDYNCCDADCEPGTLTRHTGNVELSSNHEHGSAVLNAVPNPTSGETTITYRLDADGQIRLELFDPLGKLVTVLEDTHRNRGEHTLRYDARPLAAGRYMLRMIVGDHVHITPLTIQ